jgi:hypothetical protein
VLTQLKYASRIYLNQRVYALIGTVVINLVFFVLGITRILPIGWMIFGTVLSSLSLCAVFGVCVMVDMESVKSLFAPPNAYHTMLAPVPAWQTVLSRVISMTVFDLVSFTVGIFGVVLQSTMLDNYQPWSGDGSMIPSDSIIAIILGVIAYATMFLFIILACALAKSVFYHTKARGLLGFFGMVAVGYLYSWLDLLLTPFANVNRFGAFIEVQLTAGLNTGTIAYTVLLLVKATALLIGISYLYERKVNI